MELQPDAPTEHLVFVEWFSQTSADPEPNSKMFKVKKGQAYTYQNNMAAEVVKLSTVKQSVQLIPVFPKGGVNLSWTTDTVLDTCNEFYVNNWSSIRTYQCIY